MEDREERAMMSEQETSIQERGARIEEGFGSISIIRIISGVLLYAAIVNVLLGVFNLLCVSIKWWKNVVR